MNIRKKIQKFIKKNNCPEVTITIEEINSIIDIIKILIIKDLSTPDINGKIELSEKDIEKLNKE